MKRINFYLSAENRGVRYATKIERTPHGDIEILLEEGERLLFAPIREIYGQAVADIQTPELRRLASVSLEKRVAHLTLEDPSEIILGAGLQMLPPTTTPNTILPGWKHGKLKLQSVPNGDQPGVFSYGAKTYSIPSGRAWEILQTLIAKNAFDGHGEKLPPRPGDAFKGAHRVFFTERMARGESGWHIKTV